MKRAALALLAPVLVLALVPATARASDFDRLRQTDAALLEAGWRLTTGNAQYCEETDLATGILLHDAATYPDGEDIKATLGLSGDIGVQAVATGSPAAFTGIARDDTLAAIDRDRIALFPSDSARKWMRVRELEAALSDSLKGDGLVELELIRDGVTRTVEIAGMPACRGRFEVRFGEDGASADGGSAFFGSDFPGFAYPPDEFAAAVAHELAHNLLGHPEWLAKRGRKRRDIRQTEREADRLMPWLLANAGYDPGAAIRFMQRWGPEHGGGLFRRRTHDGWDERVEMIAAEVATVEREMATSGTADWTHFRALTIAAD